MSEKATESNKASDVGAAHGAAAGVAATFDAAGAVAKLEAAAAKLEADAAGLKADAAALRAKVAGPNDAGVQAKGRPAILSNPWALLCTLAILVVVLCPVVAKISEPTELLKAWGGSAALLAAVGAFMRLIAHEGSRVIDGGGKMFAFAASVLALCATGALLFIS